MEILGFGPHGAGKGTRAEHSMLTFFHTFEAFPPIPIRG